LHAKLNLYQRNGVREYLVWRVDDKEVDWFAQREGRFEPLPPSRQGTVESEVLPGLRLDVAALVSGNLPALFQVVMEGTATPSHAQFLKRLQENARQYSANEL
jgi:hypothetical protein